MTIKDSNVPMTRYFSIYLHLGSGLEPLAVYVYITMQKNYISLVVPECHALCS